MLDIFITSHVIFTTALAVLGSPVFVVAWRRRRTRTAINFSLSALVIATMCATISVVSDRQVAQCFAAGRTDCIDSGAAGLQLLFVGGFVIVAWLAAFFMWRD